jgi:hypothetical protein
MKRVTRVRLYKAIGLVLCILPPAIATLSYFPLWVRSEGSGFSLLSLLLLLVCAIPARKMLKDFFRTPSAWKLWLVLLVALTLFENISEGLRAIACVGFPTGALGAVFFRLAAREAEKERRAGGEGEDTHRE